MCEVNEKYIAEIIELIKTNHTHYLKALTSKNKKKNIVDRSHLLKYILDFTSFLDKEDFKYTLQTRIFLTIHKFKELPKCLVCGNEIKNYNVVKNILNKDLGFKKTCSKECSRHLATEVTEKRNLKKYGVKNVF